MPVLLIPLESKMSEAIEAIRIERERQDKKWGVQNHNLMTWLGILAEEFGEAAKEINEFHFRDAWLEDVRAELVQTAAVAVAMVEYIDRHSVKDLKEREQRA